MQSFNSKFHFSTLKFPIRVSKLGAHMNCLDCNHISFYFLLFVLERASIHYRTSKSGLSTPTLVGHKILPLGSESYILKVLATPVIIRLMFYWNGQINLAFLLPSLHYMYCQSWYYVYFFKVIKNDGPVVSSVDLKRFLLYHSSVQAAFLWTLTLIFPEWQKSFLFYSSLEMLTFSFWGKYLTLFRLGYFGTIYFIVPLPPFLLYLLSNYH